MSGRSLRFALFRPGVVVGAILGTSLLIQGWTTLGALAFAFAIGKAVHILSYDDLDVRLQLRTDKRRHSIRRRLYAPEQKELLALRAYAERLESSGADPKLAQETMVEAWKILADVGAKSGAERLRRLRASLPPLDKPWAASDGLAERISDELHLLRAAHLEVESVG